MGCNPEQLSAYSDGMLDEVARRKTERHLACCPACRDELDELRRLKAVLQRVPPPRPPRRLADVVVGTVRFREVRRQRRGPKIRFWQGAAVGSMLVLAVLGLWMLVFSGLAPSRAVFASPVDAVVSEHRRHDRSWPLPPVRKPPRRRAAFAPAFPAYIPPGYAFVDSGIGSLGNVQFVHWRFDDGAHLLSLFQLPALEGDGGASVGGEPRRRREGDIVVASDVRHGFLFVIVGKLPPAEAEAMLNHLYVAGDAPSPQNKRSN